MPKVSVIIPCYNQGQYLDEAVDSVLNQTFEDFEIIIVNDGSTDDFTNNLLVNYHKPKTKVISTQNQGLPSARNNGIKIASGEYICCLDADDKYHPQFLEKTVAVIENDHEHRFGIVTTWIQTFGEQDCIWKTDSYNPYRLATENIIHVASLFRKECWEKVGGYATNLSGYQDWNFWISITAQGYEWYRIEEPLFFYRIRKNSMVTNSNKKRMALYSQIVENNFSFYQKNLKDILLQFLKRNEELNKEVTEVQTNNLDLMEKYNKLEEEWKEIKQENEAIKNSEIYYYGLLLKNATLDYKKFMILPLRLCWIFLPGKLKRFIKKLLQRFKRFSNIFFYKRIKVNNQRWDDDTPLVSVIIPCYNYGQFLEDAIDSVLNQTFKNIEIIVVDDGSTDLFTKKVIQNLNKPKTKVIVQENQKIPATRNNGIKIARGKYICCLDADDMLMPTYLEKCVIKMEYYNLDICYSYIKEFGDSNRIFPTLDFRLQDLIKNNCVAVSAVFKRDMWLKSGGCNNKMVHGYEDWDFWINLAKHGAIGGIVHEPLFLYRKHGHSMIDDALEKDKMLREMIKENHKEIYTNKALLKKAVKRQRVQYKVRNGNLNLVGRDTDSRDIFLLIVDSLEITDAILTKINALKKEDSVISIIALGPSDSDVLKKYEMISDNVYCLENFIKRDQWLDFIDYIFLTRSVNIVAFCLKSSKNNYIINHIKNRYSGKTIISL